MIVLVSISLDSPVSTLFGVGDKYAKLLDINLGIKAVENLLNHFPQRYEDYSNIKKFEDIQNGELVTVIGKIIETKNIFTRRIKIQEIQIEDVLSSTQSRARLTFFNQPFLLQSLRLGMTIAVSGTAEKPGVKLQFKSPEYELIKFPIPKFKVPTENLVHTGRLTPIYPETRGISSKWLRARIFPLIAQIQSLITDFLPENILKQENLVDLQTAYKNVHYPESSGSLAKANLRLAFNELLIAQLTSAIKKQEWREGKSKKIQVDNHEREIQNLIRSLPFTLTDSQNKSIEEIFSDIAQSKPMNRLLEGDVGSGKTVVAALAMYLAYLNGFLLL